MSAMIMNGKTPTLISGVPNVAVSLATIRSQASATPSAPARTWPPARPAARAGPPRRADRRLAEFADELEQAHEPLRAEVLVHQRHLAREAGQVAAAGEDLLVRGGEHDAAHVLVVAGALEGLDGLLQQLVGEGVARVGVVEGDRRDPVGGGVADLHRPGPYPRRKASRAASVPRLGRRWRCLVPRRTVSSPRVAGFVVARTVATRRRLTS